MLTASASSSSPLPLTVLGPRERTHLTAAVDIVKKGSVKGAPGSAATAAGKPAVVPRPVASASAAASTGAGGPDFATNVGPQALQIRLPGQEEGCRQRACFQ